MASAPPPPPASLTRNAIIPISLVLCFALTFWAGLPLWQVALAASPLLALYALAPRWGARSLAAFDRDALGLRAGKRPGALRERYRAARAMRLFAPPALVAEREGMVHAEAGEGARAYDAYRRAASEWGEGAPLPVLLGLAHAAYLAEEDAEAIRAYRRIEEASPGLPKVGVRLAHALLRSGQLREARARLDGPIPTDDAEEARALRSELRRARRARRKKS